MTVASELRGRLGNAPAAKDAARPLGPLPPGMHSAQASSSLTSDGKKNGTPAGSLAPAMADRGGPGSGQHMRAGGRGEGGS